LSDGIEKGAGADHKQNGEEERETPREQSRRGRSTGIGDHHGADRLR